MTAARQPVAFATRYAGLFGVQLRMATLAAMQYRVDFIARGFIAFLWSALTLIPLLVVFGVRHQVAGWSFAEALVVVAWFMLLRAVLNSDAFWSPANRRTARSMRSRKPSVR